MMKALRSRLYYFAFIMMVILLGLGSRYFSRSFPEVINVYLGDTLWGLMVFLLCGFIFRAKSSQYVAGTAALFAMGIEVSQLYHAPWIDAIRNTTLGGLVLGYIFLWSDVVCYVVGITVGFLVERYMLRRERI
jgi:hypothetical protein